MKRVLAHLKYTRGKGQRTKFVFDAFGVVSLYSRSANHLRAAIPRD